MSNRGPGRSDDRRRQPRVSCRLHGRITHGREKIRARIVDISEGGLCLLSPVWLDPKKPIAIAIEVPGRETATVHVEIWHIRREKSRSSNGKVWVAGAVLRDADTAYAQLLTAAGLLEPTVDRSSTPGAAPAATKSTAAATATAVPPRPAAPPATSPSRTVSNAQPTADSIVPTSVPPTAAPAQSTSDTIDELEPRIFRLRCKARGSPRTRVLSLAAESVEEAHKLAQPDLGAEWDILEVLET